MADPIADNDPRIDPNSPEYDRSVAALYKAQQSRAKAGVEEEATNESWTEANLKAYWKQLLNLPKSGSSLGTLTAEQIEKQVRDKWEQANPNVPAVIRDQKWTDFATSTLKSIGSDATGPKSPQQSALDQQAKNREADALKAQLQRQAEDKYILDSGGKVSRNPQTGGLESSTKDETGRYSATTPHTYDPKTGLITEQAPVGWRSETAGNTLDPRGAVWNDQSVSPAQWEDLRRLNWADRSQWIRDNLKREPTAADLMSGPGGQFMFGDPNYYRNLTAIQSTGKSLPGMSQVVNSFSNAGAVPQTLSYGQSQPVQEMSQRESDLYRFTGKIDESGLGGRTLGELQDQATFGSDALPVAAREKFWRDMATTGIGDAQQYFADLSGRGRTKRPPSLLEREEEGDVQYQALGADNLVGMAQVNQQPQIAPSQLLPANIQAANIQQPLADPPPLPQMSGSAMLEGPATPYTGPSPFDPGGALYGKRWNGITGQYENAWDGSEQDDWEPDMGDPRYRLRTAYSLRNQQQQPSNPNRYPRNRGPIMFAGGGGFMTDEPVGMVGLQSGDLKAVAGEAGPEAINVRPTNLPTMSGAAPTAAQPPLGPTPVQMIREQAKAMRPAVPIRVAG